MTPTPSSAHVTFFTNEVFLTWEQPKIDFMDMWETGERRSYEATIDEVMRFLHS